MVATAVVQVSIAVSKLTVVIQEKLVVPAELVVAKAKNVAVPVVVMQVYAVMMFAALPARNVVTIPAVMQATVVTGLSAVIQEKLAAMALAALKFRDTSH